MLHLLTDLTPPPLLVVARPLAQGLLCDPRARAMEEAPYLGREGARVAAVEGGTEGR